MKSDIRPDSDLVAENNWRIFASSAAGLAEGEAYRKQYVSLVRYADPISWAAVAAVTQVLIPHSEAKADGSGQADALDKPGAHDQIGIISCSLFGPTATMQHVARAAASGTVSPLRFPAANPGALAGVPAIVFRLRGPTLNFTMAPVDALPVVKMMASAWLKQGAASSLLLICESPDELGESQVRCLHVGLSEEESAHQTLSPSEATEPDAAEASDARKRMPTAEAIWNWWSRGDAALNGWEMLQ